MDHDVANENGENVAVTEVDDLTSEVHFYEMAVSTWNLKLLVETSCNCERFLSNRFWPETFPSYSKLSLKKWTFPRILTRL